MKATFFDRTISVLENALDFRAERHRHLASNLANAETPGYKPTDIRFEDALKNALPVSATHPSHIAAKTPATGGASPAYRPTEPEGYDRNAVGVEAEMVRLSENTIMYTAVAKMLKGKFGMLMTAIKEGGR